MINKAADHIFRTIAGLGLLFLFLLVGYCVSLLLPEEDMGDAPMLLKACGGLLVAFVCTAFGGLVLRIAWYWGSLILGRPTGDS